MSYISFFFLSINSVLQILMLSPFYQIKLLRILVGTFEFHSTWGLKTTLEVHLGDLFLANRDVFKSSRIIIDPVKQFTNAVKRCCSPPPDPYTEALICGGDGAWRWLGLGDIMRGCPDGGYGALIRGWNPGLSLQHVRTEQGYDLLWNKKLVHTRRQICQHLDHDQPAEL